MAKRRQQDVIELPNGARQLRRPLFEQQQQQQQQHRQQLHQHHLIQQQQQQQQQHMNQLHHQRPSSRNGSCKSLKHRLLKTITDLFVSSRPT